MEAFAQMKYHHSERCFTYRMVRPMALSHSSGWAPSRFGITGVERHFHERRFVWTIGLAQWHLLPSRRSSGWPREDPTVLNRAPIEGCSSEYSLRVLFRDICQMGSLAGAAYLLHDNAGVLRQAQWEQKSHVAHKRKGLLD